MGFLLLAIACRFSLIGPAVAAAGFDIGVPGQQGFLFGATVLTLAAIAAGLAFQNRYNIWRLPVSWLTRLLLLAGGCAATCLIAYLFVYNFCVVEHPLYSGKLLLPPLDLRQARRNDREGRAAGMPRWKPTAPLPCSTRSVRCLEGTPLLL